MKRLLIFFCVLMLLPLSGYAVSISSPTAETIVFMEPVMLATPIDKLPNRSFLLERLAPFNELYPDYVMLDGLKIFLDKPFEKVKWHLSLPIQPEHELQVLTMDAAAVYFQEYTLTDNGTVIVDFSEYELGFYFIFFYIKPLI